MEPIALIDDKHVPLYRILWISDTPHFCGEEDCTREGEYEVRLEMDDSLWISRKGRDTAVAALREWCSGGASDNDNKQW
ncbi:MAG: hypothetical protein AAFP90_04050 [Planctomycetota bacterium]